MKKVMFILFMFFSINLFSQKTYSSYKSVLGLFNETTHDWEWRNANYHTLKITEGEEEIKINRKPPKIYKKKEILPSAPGFTDKGVLYTSKDWLCHNEEGNPVLVDFVLYKENEMVCIVTNGKYCIKYYIKK